MCRLYDDWAKTEMLAKMFMATNAGQPTMLDGGSVITIAYHKHFTCIIRQAKDRNRQANNFSQRVVVQESVKN